jgi:hypothetical protein
LVLIGRNEAPPILDRFLEAGGIADVYGDWESERRHRGEDVISGWLRLIRNSGLF